MSTVGDIEGTAVGRWVWVQQGRGGHEEGGHGGDKVLGMVMALGGHSGGDEPPRSL